MYLSSSVRKGISSFHNYCLELELESGLNKLQEDIETGAINEIMENYKNENCGYLFISCCAH